MSVATQEPTHVKLVFAMQEPITRHSIENQAQNARVVTQEPTLAKLVVPTQEPTTRNSYAFERSKILSHNLGEAYARFHESMQHL